MVEEVTPVSESLTALKLKLVFSFMSLHVKEVLYTKLKSVTDGCPQQDIHNILEDFNVVTGCDRAGNEMSNGSHGSG